MAVVSGHKAELKEQLPEQTEFDILEDASLSANQCIIETEDKMIDCSLDVQLQNLQEKLFGLPSDAPCAEAVSTADGSWKRTFTGGSSCTAVCPVGSKVYFGAADSAQVLSARI